MTNEYNVMSGVNRPLSYIGIPLLLSTNVYVKLIYINKRHIFD